MAGMIPHRSYSCETPGKLRNENCELTICNWGTEESESRRAFGAAAQPIERQHVSLFRRKLCRKLRRLPGCFRPLFVARHQNSGMFYPVLGFAER